jgi:cytochrome c551/c552
MRTKDVLILLSPVLLVIVAIVLVRPVLVPSQPPIAPPNPVPTAGASPVAAASPGAAASPVAAAGASPIAAAGAAATPAAGQQAAGGGMGNPQNGAQLFVSKGCSGCHKIADIPGAVGQVGPELTHVGTVAASRKPGLDAEAYIRESVRQPAAFLAPGFPNDMPMLPVSDAELNDLVAMLLAHQ